uniref:Aldehyde dehydrogenase NAD(P)+-like protein n=2 Tax=Schistosoma japonicum TaxID=6182 RepID=A9XKA4_SCHJA|nr:aldehyde dehydrogenase NAD(P)+-like protein [Schistosoma japonicum]
MFVKKWWLSRPNIVHIPGIKMSLSSSRLGISSWLQLIPENRAFYSGKWEPSLSGKTLSVLNPATGELLGSVPACSRDECEISVNVASISQKEWALKTPDERYSVIRKWADTIRQNIDSLADLIVAENGKSLSDARTEVLSGVSALEWYSEEAKRVFGYHIPSLRSHSRHQLIVHQPIGVVGVITPWNFPLSMITRKVGAALASGCSVIVKPAEDTPLTSLAVAYLGVEKAGIPPGVLNVITAAGDDSGAEQVGNVLCTHPLVRLVGFTGSTKVGTMLYTKAAECGKRVLLEMGGNAPFIIFDSANIDKAVAGATGCKFRCSGQTCISANRIFVHDKVHDVFVSKLTEAVSLLHMGNGVHPDVKLGPVINEKALNKIEKLVNSAVENGAQTLIGGHGRLKGKNSFGFDYSNGYFYPATVLSNCHTKMTCMEEEVFGPVASVCKFKTEEEVIELANKTPYGLAGYIYTENINQAWRTANQLQVGMVGLNTGFVSTIELPFGGVKSSGIGREGGPNALHEFMDTKTITWDTSNN